MTCSRCGCRTYRSKFQDLNKPLCAACRAGGAGSCSRCGKRMQRTAHPRHASAPVQTCAECRGWGPGATCRSCGKSARTETTIYKEIRAGREALCGPCRNPNVGNCAICQKPLAGLSLARRTCSRTCAEALEQERKRERNRKKPGREKRAPWVGEKISRHRLLPYLLERDRNRCGICSKPIRAKTGPRRATVDHIVPLSRGGTHELANLQAAHWVCNVRKSAGGGGEQLLLVG